MKKLIAVVTLMLAFTVSAQGQNKNAAAAAAGIEQVPSDKAAKNDVSALVAKITISESLKKDMYTLMVMKHDALADPKLSAANKESISKKFEHKIMAGLSPEQREKLSADSALLQQLTH